MLHNCSYGMLRLGAIMSCLCTKAAKVVPLQSYLLNYLYLQHFHIMAVLKSNKQSKLYNKGRRQEGAGTFSFLFWTPDRWGSHIKSADFGSSKSLRGLATRWHQSLWGCHRGGGLNKVCIPALLLICHIQIYKGMQTLFSPCTSLYLKIPNQKTWPLPLLLKKKVLNCQNDVNVNTNAVCHSCPPGCGQVCFYGAYFHCPHLPLVNHSKIYISKGESYFAISLHADVQNKTMCIFKH